MNVDVVNEQTLLYEIYRRAKNVIENPMWSGVCDEEVFLEEAVRNYEKYKINGKLLK